MRALIKLKFIKSQKSHLLTGDSQWLLRRLFESEEMTQCLITWLFPRAMMVNSNSSTWFLSLSIPLQPQVSPLTLICRTPVKPFNITALKTHLHQHQLYLAQMPFMNPKGPPINPISLTASSISCFVKACLIRGKCFKYFNLLWLVIKLPFVYTFVLNRQHIKTKPINRPS